MKAAARPYASGARSKARPRWTGSLSAGLAKPSLLLLAGLGSYLAMREGDLPGTDAATIMAQHDVTADHAVSADRDLMLVTLSTYGE